MFFRMRLFTVLVSMLVIGGCGSPVDGPPPARVKTEAEEVSQAYFKALTDKDWPTAYRSLDAESKAGCTEQQFSQRAESYYKSIGFEPDEVVVQSCDERDGTAIAHVSLKGLSGSSLKFYKDAVALKRGASGWAVVLPATFGQVKPRKG